MRDKQLRLGAGDGFLPILCEPSASSEPSKRSLYAFSQGDLWLEPDEFDSDRF